MAWIEFMTRSVAWKSTCLGPWSMLLSVVGWTRRWQWARTVLGAVGTLGALGWWRNAQQIEINVTALTGCIDFLAKKDQIALWLQEILLVKPGSRWSHWEGRSFQEVARGVEEFFLNLSTSFAMKEKIRLHLFAEEHFAEVFFLYFFLVGNSVKRWNFRKEWIQFRPCQFVMLRCGIHMNMFCCWRHWRHAIFVGFSPAKDIVRPTVSVWMAKMPKMRCRECCWERKSRLILGFAFHLIWNSIETNLWHWDTSLFCLCYKPRSPGTPEEDLGRIRLKNKKLFFC